ncbi:MAG: dihydrodipicolinate synthase family protein [Saprospiraceae bacterium]|nr:dihydrodipicolinate synthase family protein [Saprospiraceae bacterium]
MKFSDGVITAPLTPLQEDLSLHSELMLDHCQQLLERGCNGLAVLGTTGEASSFSVQERKQVLESLSSIDPQQIMLGTGCCSFQDTIELTKHGLDHGVTNFLMLPPYYYKQVDDVGLLQYFDKVINAVASSSLNIYLYHFPKLAGVAFSDHLLEMLLTAHPESIVGMKDSTGDWTHMESVLDAHPGFRLYAGTETYLLETLKKGGCGCISATANVTASLAVQSYRAWTEHQDVSLHQDLIKVRKTFEGLPFTGALKGYLAATTGDRTWLNVRPPNQILEGDKLQTLLQQLDRLEFSVMVR